MANSLHLKPTRSTLQSIHIGWDHENWLQSKVGPAIQDKFLYLYTDLGLLRQKFCVVIRSTEP